MAAGRNLHNNVSQRFFVSSFSLTCCQMMGIDVRLYLNLFSVQKNTVIDYYKCIISHSSVCF